jgi:DNA topoisomerase I
VLILQLHEETEDGTVLEKIAVYQRANKEVLSFTIGENQLLVSSFILTLGCPFSYTQVAIICNHQRSVSKSHESQMTRMNEKIDELKVWFMLQVISSNFCHSFGIS